MAIGKQVVEFFVKVGGPFLGVEDILGFVVEMAWALDTGILQGVRPGTQLPGAAPGN